jgi:sulfur carrier protein
MVDALQVQVNGENSAFPAGTTVEQVVTTISQNLKGVAVALNSEVVPRSAWSTTALSHGDHLEVLTAAQGG